MSISNPQSSTRSKRTKLADSSEIIAMESDDRDRISDLPSLIIDQILDSMPVRDAARTSILSRKWRYVWASHPTIILHPNFLKNEQIGSQCDFMEIVTRIIFQHVGPIHKFSLKFPHISSADSFYPYVDHVLLFLSRNGIREITLQNMNDKAYSLPSYVFSAPELSHLVLTNCIFKLPNNFQGFHGLAYLKLVCVSFLLSKSSSVLSTPHLECLILLNCTGVRQFKISAPKLNILYIRNNDDVDLSDFLMSKNLETAIVVVSVQKPLHNRIGFTKIFECWPVISWLYIDGHTLTCLAVDSELHRLPTICSSMKHLVVKRIKFGDMRQISLVLCLLRSFPLLSRLEISVDSHEENATESVSTYLSKPECTIGVMDNLQTVTIESFNGTKAELLFVKLLLSCSPRLKMIAVQESPSSSLSEKFSTSKQLMRLSRASKEAVLVFEPDVKIPVYNLSKK